MFKYDNVGIGLVLFWKRLGLYLLLSVTGLHVLFSGF